MAKVVNILGITAGGGGGIVDLIYHPFPDKGVIENSAGTDATITLVDTINAGLMSPDDFDKLVTFPTNDNFLHTTGDEVKAGNLTLTDMLILPDLAAGLNETNNLGVDDQGNVVTIPLGSGQTVPVRNTSGSTLFKGKAVYVDGASGNRALVKLALADPDINTSVVLGLITTDINNNNNGTVTTGGVFNNIDTSIFGPGDQLYLSHTIEGDLTNVPPPSPNAVVRIGTVTNVHSTQGSILLNIHIPVKLDNIVDVVATSPANGDILKYDLPSNLWVAVPDSGGGGTVGPGTVNQIPKFLTTTTLGDSNIAESATGGRIGIATAPISEAHLNVNGNISCVIGGDDVKLGFAVNDSFVDGINSFCHYGLTRTSEGINPNMSLSGFFGIKFYTDSTRRMTLVRGGRLLIGNIIDNNVDTLQVNGFVNANGYKIPGGTSAQFLTADGGVSAGGGGGSSTLDGLTDVTITAPANNQVLTYNGTIWVNAAQTGGGGGGTVTSIAALTLGTTGTDLNSSVANPTTTPVITLNVPTASATNRGVLSTTDWTTFNGKVPSTRLININGNGQNLVTNVEWRVGQADTGVLFFDGLTPDTTTTINVGAVYGYIVNNESNPAIPTYTLINIPEEFGVAVPVGVGLAHYVYVNNLGVIQFLTNKPTSAQRKAGLYLGKVSHPAGIVGVIINEPDFITSPLAQKRDLFEALGPFINKDVYPVPNGANMFINISAGAFFGDGINFVISKTDPDRIVQNFVTNAPIAYRLRGGQGGAAASGIIAGSYDDGVNLTPQSIPGGPNASTNQYLWAIPGQGFIMQYGQTVYGSLDLAKAAVGKEANVIFSNLPGNAILLAVLSVRSGATLLNDLTHAQFFKADKLGQIGSAGGGTSGGGSSVVQITITAVGSITTATTATDLPGEVQHGKNVILDNATALSIECLGGTTATYCKFGAGAVTFTAGAGRTLTQVDGTNILNGAQGSTAALWSVGTIDFLRISNA